MSVIVQGLARGSIGDTSADPKRTQTDPKQTKKGPKQDQKQTQNRLKIVPKWTHNGSNGNSKRA